MLAQLLLLVLASCLAGNPYPPKHEDYPPPPTTGPVKCDQQWECKNVTKDFNFVECKDHKCVCRKDQGFSGTATATCTGKCHCEGEVYWAKGKAFW